MSAEWSITGLENRKVDARPDLRVAELAAEQSGVVSLADLRRCGLSYDAVRGRVKRGWLHRLYRGVFAVGHRNLSPEGISLAAVFACGADAAGSYRLAGALWGALDWDERPPEVTVLGRGTHVVPGVKVHRTGVLEAVDRRRHRGVPVTAPARTLIDLAGCLDERSLSRCIRQSQSLGIVSMRQILEAQARLGPRRGAATLAKVLASGPAPTRSRLEDVVLDLIIGAGFERPNVNLPLLIGGRRVIPDFRWPAQRLIVEADSVQWHENPLARAADAERQALLEAHGERVLRVTFHQAVGEPRRTVRRFEAAGAPTIRSSGR